MLELVAEREALRGELAARGLPEEPLSLQSEWLDALKPAAKG